MRAGTQFAFGLGGMVGICCVLVSCLTQPKKGGAVSSTTPTSAPSASAPSTSAPSASAPGTEVPSVTAELDPPAQGRELRQVRLVGDAPVPVPGSDLTVHISGSSHKVRAPLVTVQILVVQASKKAEVGWRIRSGQIDPEWMPLQGRRWDSDLGSYLEEEIPGWLVRLDSIDDQSAGGDPIAITISLKRAAH